MWIVAKLLVLALGFTLNSELPKFFTQKLRVLLWDW